ncbi:hypothetical protein TPHA_0M02130 [Tetrapisispora phaffii CBS 4417]|uniref:Protein OCA4 n=1 Tax=Tetrapisispora phaffii (strain ATCC 24235 / CBS 4417 / NBRC 1672 / NRRL Y-8282 / UCD 70-5) TaxID=1071381 RepID=G8C0S2_TETPH|nr:hypothetical protein TPHA_0M02130 [Tetrapisispora phaffii CBS 4417]CCE65787.1 hypothetical protein TPHA_0M02130 [Tetrapisispora phaffii CBS 4417]
MLVPPANFGIAEEGIYRCAKVETLNLSFLETLNLKTVLFIGGQEPSKYFKEFFKNSNICWHSIRNIDFSPPQEVVDIYKQSGDTINPESNPGPSNSNDSLVQALDASKDNNHKKATNITNNNDNQNSKDNEIKDNETSELITEDSDSKSKSRYRKYVLNDNDESMIIKAICLKKTFEYLMNIDHHNILLVDRTNIVVGILRKLQKWNIASILNEYRLFAGKNGNYFAETFLDIIKLSIKQDIDKIKKTTSINQIQMKQTEKKFDKKDKNDKGGKNTKKKVHSGSNKNKSKVELVNEDDLLKAPSVPSRILKLIGDVEVETQSRMKSVQEEENETNSKNDNKSHGIFGNEYRLAFNKRELGEYEYYKTSQKELTTKKTKEKKIDDEKIDEPTNKQLTSKSEDNTVIIQVPVESKLPSWFIYQRNLWEQTNVIEEHNFYAENIFS